MINCPNCGKTLEARVNPYQGNDIDYIEIEMQCENEHVYFFRIKEDDLLESK